MQVSQPSTYVYEGKRTKVQNTVHEVSLRQTKKELSLVNFFSRNIKNNMVKVLFFSILMSLNHVENIGNPN